MLEIENPARTSCCILVDKEEIGSVGATGMHSRFFENTVAELIQLTEGGSEVKARRARGAAYFLLKSKRKVGGEFALMATGYNLSRAENMFPFNKLMSLVGE